MLRFLLVLPYRAVWRLLKLLGRTPRAVVFCAEPMDAVILRPVLSHLKPMPFVAKNGRTARALEAQGIRARRWPVFPEAVIMCRHAASLFPEPRILKIGFRHGAYHFKKFTAAGRYNAFDLYFVTSAKEEEEARTAGIRSARAGGFPKMDPAFDGSFTPRFLEAVREKTGMDPRKKTVLFTATHNRSGMSAAGRWIGRLDRFTEEYNVWVTLHPWISRRTAGRLKRMRDIFFVDSDDGLPYIYLSDVVVGDMSSILAEACALEKPLITFRVPKVRRTPDDVVGLLERISVRIRSAEELAPAIRRCLEHPAERRAARREASRLFFDRLDGRAGERCARMIRARIESLP